MDYFRDIINILNKKIKKQIDEEYLIYYRTLYILFLYEKCSYKNYEYLIDLSDEINYLIENVNDKLKITNTNWYNKYETILKEIKEENEKIKIDDEEFIKNYPNLIKDDISILNDIYDDNNIYEFINYIIDIYPLKDYKPLNINYIKQFKFNNKKESENFLKQLIILYQKELDKTEINNISDKKNKIILNKIIIYLNSFSHEIVKIIKKNVEKYSTIESNSDFDTH